MRKRGLCCGPVSVRLSRWCIVSTRPKISSNLLFSLVVPSLQSFRHRAPIPNSKGNTFSEGAKYKRVENFVIFDGNRRLSRIRYEIGPWLLWNVNRKSYALE